MKIVSLNCSNTEIVCALGCAETLVGVDSDSDYPEEVVARLPRLGRDLEIDIGKVAALRPDLVLASLTVPGHERVIAGLEAAKLPYLAPETIFLEDVFGDIRAIAARLGVSSRGEDLCAALRAGVHHDEPLPASGGPKILVEWWPKPVIAPGRLSWVNDLLRLAGAENPLGSREVKSAPLPDAEVARLDPDAIVISWCGIKPQKYRPEVLYRNERFRGLRAIVRRQVFCVPEAFLGRPGPRLVSGYQRLREIVAAVDTGG